MVMWEGRFKKEIDKRTNDFNSSISFDKRMYKEDITGSIAHATMLGECGIISSDESKKIIEGLKEICNDLETGKLEFDMEAEDISVLVPAKDAEDLAVSLRASLKDEMAKGLEVKADKSLATGFRIGIKDGAAYYDFSAESVAELFSAYLNPKTAAIMKEAAASIGE